jgi:hypothetical protein
MKLGCQQPVNATFARMQDPKAATRHGPNEAQQGYLVFSGIGQSRRPICFRILDSALAGQVFRWTVGQGEEKTNALTFK